MALLRAAMGDRDAGVAAAAYEAVLRSVGAADAEAHRAALGSRHVVVRALAAYRCRGCAAEAVWETLRVHLDDEAGLVRCTALQSLDALGPSRVDHLLEGLASPAVDLQVTAAELGVARGLGALVEPMRRLLSDSGLGTRLGAAEAAALRTRAAGALAALGNPSLVGYFSATLLRDGAEPVRRVAARAMARASRTEHTPHLLDALAHDDAWVRAEAADGLARLGDLRALPVLLGNLRHHATALRAAALVSFAALGRDGEAGLVQGLEDPDRALQELVLAVVLARDLRALARGDGPELLTSALSSQRAEVRVRAAARARAPGRPPRPTSPTCSTCSAPCGGIRGLCPRACPTRRCAPRGSWGSRRRWPATTPPFGTRRRRRSSVVPTPRPTSVALRDFEAHGVAPACAAPDARRGPYAASPGLRRVRGPPAAARGGRGRSTRPARGRGACGGARGTPRRGPRGRGGAPGAGPRRRAPPRAARGPGGAPGAVPGRSGGAARAGAHGLVAGRSPSSA
jgi:HEAT repeat protein